MEKSDKKWMGVVVIKKKDKLGNLNFNMQPKSLIKRLWDIICQIKSQKQANSPEPYSCISNLLNDQIKTQLNKYYEFASQQIIKLSAYYEAKLQYQAIDYEQEIDCLKQEIERQYKVIGLMKLELEDLVVLVNQQRNQPKNKHQREAEDELSIKQRMRDEQQHKEWRVKKSESALLYTQKPNNKIYESKQDNQKTPLNQTQQCPQSYSRSVSTISGLQIIAEEQTQRTLMSAGDQQGYPIDPDYFENDLQDQDQPESINGLRQPGTVNDPKTQIQGDLSEQKFQVEFPDSQQKNSRLTHMRIEDGQDNLQQSSEPQKKSSLHYEHNNFSQNPTDNLFHKDEPHFKTQSNCQIHPTLSESIISQHHSSSLVLQQKKTYINQPNLAVNLHLTHTGHLLNFLEKPQLKNVENSQILSKNQQKQQRVCQKNNFVQNPFIKKAPEGNSINNISRKEKPLNEYSFFNQQTQNQQKSIYQKETSQQLFQKQTKGFLTQYRPQFTQVHNHNSNKQKSSKPKSNSSMMSILQMIAANNFEPQSKRSQRSNKLSSSRSKSKSKKQGKKSIQNKSSAKHRKQSNKNSIYYNYQTQQHPEIESQNNSRFTMVRCPTSEDITQRNNPKSFDQTECLTSNDFRDHSEYQSYDKDFRSFHTTFGRPTSSQFLKEQLSLNNKEINLQNFLINYRKGSVKSKKQPPVMKENFGNKENERQRRMSQKTPNSKPSNIVSKKTSTKYLKPNASFASQQSVQSMLQSHLENSNKFLVGAKKQQVKYDGQKMALGQQQIRHGHGTLYYSNGLIYEGEFFQNKRQGFGLLKFNHVELYSGQWQNDQLWGKGKIRNCAIINKKKKQLTQGTSSNSNINPLNNNTFAKWISYCGEFMNNRFEREGTLYLQGGEKFVGWFRNGVADGEGSLYRKNGQVENGIWRNNVLVEGYSA